MSISTSRGRRAEVVAVAAWLMVGVALRWWHLDLGWFGVDQARDIQTGLDIAAGRDWPTVGPTMRRVTSLGALYHYVWALPHVLSDDPIAAYAFAALLGTLTLVAVWAFARRSWGSRAALVSLAVLATSPVAVLDGRVAWAPAALPLVAMAVVWLLVGQPTSPRLAALGAVLGLAVQLHLAMVAFGVAALVLVLARWPGWRSASACVLGFVATGFPAVYAALANAGQDAGLATLPGRGPIPHVVDRLGAALALGWRVPVAFWQWPDAPMAAPLAMRAAVVLLLVSALLGVARLFRASLGGERAAAAVLTTLVAQVTMVAMLPGEAWYYYLDATWPLWALAAGCWCPDLDAGGASQAGRRAFARLAPGGAMAAALILACYLASWIAVGARHGYVVVNPGALTLDGAGGRDAAVTGRLLSLRTKRAVAALLGEEPADFATKWLTTHGPAFDDATGDNGFWLRRTSSSGVMTPDQRPRHAVLWYRDDPTAPSAPAPGFVLDAVGPIVVARYQPAIAYASCHDDAGAVSLPIRIVPHPRRYGDGTIARPPVLPRRIDCTVATGSGGTRVVAAVTSGTVALRAGTGATSPAGRTSTLCLMREERPVPFTIEIDVPHGVASDLDLYEEPDPACAGKIAP